VDQSSPDYASDAKEIVVCNAVFRLSISSSVPEILAIEVRSRPKSHRKKHVFGPQFFWGEDPQILDLVFKIAPISDHVAKFRGDRRRDRRDLALNKKKRKNKQQQNIRAALRYPQRAPQKAINRKQLILYLYYCTTVY